VKKGDWIELRDAPNTRGIIRARFTAQGKIAVHLSGDPVYTLIDLTVLREHWESMQFEGKPIPYWCRPKSSRAGLLGTTSPRTDDVVGSA